MKPSVDDQLREIRRTLLEVVLPDVVSDHVADTVRRMAADLRKLASCWSAQAPFDRWDVEALERVLADLDVAIEPASSTTDDGARQEDLRHRLATALPHLPPPPADPERWRPVLAYFAERLDRDPMTNRTPA